MMRPSQVRRLAWVVAGTSALGGALLLAMPPSGTVVPLAPLAADTSSVPASPLNPAIAEDIAVANVFAVSRTAPTLRYAPGEVPGEADPGTMSFVEASPEDGADMGGPQLLGTVVAPDGPKALLQLDSTIPGARLYAVGEQDAGFTIVSIAPRVVVLRRAGGGRVTLRLDPEEDRP